MYGGSDILHTLMQATSYLWPPICMLLALASLLVAVVCTMRKRYLLPSWLMFGCWSVFTVTVTLSTIMYLPSLGLYGEWTRWVGHLFTLMEMACEIGFGISILLFRPAHEVATKGVQHG